jgi:hypothetical protein
MMQARLDSNLETVTLTWPSLAANSVTTDHPTFA